MIPFNYKLTESDIERVNNFLAKATADAGHDNAKLPLKTSGSYHILVSVHLSDIYDEEGNPLDNS